MPATIPQHNDNEHHSHGLLHLHAHHHERDGDEGTTPATAKPTPIPNPKLTPAPPPFKRKKSKKNKGVVKRVFGSFSRHHHHHHHHRSSSSERQKKAKKQPGTKSKATASPPNIAVVKAKGKAKTVAAAPGDRNNRDRDRDYWLADRQLVSRRPDRPSRSGVGIAEPVSRDQHQDPTGGERDERTLVVQQWQRSLWERERERRTAMAEDRQQAGATSTTTPVAGGHSENPGAARTSAQTQMKSRPANANINANASAAAAGPGAGGGPLTLQTRKMSNVSSNNVNYCYPLCSPKSNRENPFTSAAIVRRRESDDSSNNEQYASDASSSAPQASDMTIKVYRWPSLAQGSPDNDGSNRNSNDNGKGRIGLGLSIRETLDRNKPAPSTPQDAHRGDLLRADYFDGGGGQGKLRRKMSTAATRRGNQNQNHRQPQQQRTPGRISKVVHRRRQTRYGRPSLRNGTRASPTSTYYENVHGPVSTPGFMAHLASGGDGDEAWQEPPSPPINNNNNNNGALFFPTTGPRRCPGPGCTSNKPVLPGGLCEDCTEDYQPRKSTFGSPVAARRAPSIDPIEFNRMFGPIDTPADKVASKFNPKYSPKFNPEFKLLQPPPGRRAMATKNDSARSTGSERSHVGFQIAAIPKTPERGQHQQQQQRYSDNGKDQEQHTDEDFNDRESATSSQGNRESYYTDASRESLGFSTTKSWDSEDPPSPLQSPNTGIRGSAETNKEDDEIADIYDAYKYNDNGNQQQQQQDKGNGGKNPLNPCLELNHDGCNADYYDVWLDILDGYLKDNELDEIGNQRKKEAAIASYADEVVEIGGSVEALKITKSESTASNHGVPQRRKVVKKPRDSGGSGRFRETDINAQSEQGPRDNAVEPGKPKGNWI